MPVPVSSVSSAARAMPKSITRGPPGARRTFDGFRSRWISPAAWMAFRASDTPAIRMSTVRSGMGPYSWTASRSDGPGTYAVTNHGAEAAGSASSTCAV
jgi:hypothetical protein